MKIVKPERKRIPADKRVWEIAREAFKGKYDIEIPEYVTESTHAVILRKQ